MSKRRNIIIYLSELSFFSFKVKISKQICIKNATIVTHMKVQMPETVSLLSKQTTMDFFKIITLKFHHLTSEINLWACVWIRSGSKFHGHTPAWRCDQKKNTLICRLHVQKRIKLQSRRVYVWSSRVV